MIFVISRMWVSFGEYHDLEYSPISTIATIGLIVVAMLFVLCQLSTVLTSGLNRLVISFMLTCLISTFLYGNPDMALLKQIVFIVFWEAMLILFYLLSCNDNNTIYECKLFYIILLVPITILVLFSNTLRGSLSYGITRTGNNLFFYILATLPWLMTSRDRLFRLICVLFVLVMSVLTLKRSAMIISVINVIIFVFSNYYDRKGNEKKSVLLGTVTIVIGLGLLFMANDIGGGVAKERIDNIEEDEGSGRIERYEDVLRLIRDEGNVGAIIFGHGYRTVETELGESASAHNDFLEVMYDYGVVGLFLFLLIHFALIKRILILRRIGSSYYEGYMMSYVIFLMMGMVSHLVIYPTYFVFLTSYWGAVEGLFVTEDSMLVDCFRKS